MRCKACNGPMGSTAYVKRTVDGVAIPEELCIHCLRAMRHYTTEDSEYEGIIKEYEDKARKSRDEWD